jgi:hypothetical protein
LESAVRLNYRMALTLRKMTPPEVRSYLRVFRIESFSNCVEEIESCKLPKIL